jgi:hypothetical protein
LSLAFALYGNFLQSKDQRHLIEELRSLSAGQLEGGEPIEDQAVLLALLKDSSAGLLYVFSHGYTPFVFPAWLDVFKRGLNAAKQRGDEASEAVLKVLTHGDFRETEAWIELTHGKLALHTLEEVTVQQLQRPIVFLNLCQSAQVMPGVSQSFVWFFLIRASARSVLGTECLVSPAFADVMGRELLRRLLRGTPLGEALRQARKDLLEVRGNPLGLAYTLWGAATSRFEPPVMTASRQLSGGVDV